MKFKLEIIEKNFFAAGDFYINGVDNIVHKEYYFDIDFEKNW